MKKIIQRKTVDYEVYVAYDGTEFSAETFDSIDAAKKQCEKYEQSAAGVITNKAMKVLKPYIVPGSDKISLDAVPEAIRKDMSKWYRWLFDPNHLAIQCIASDLLTANWSCIADNSKAVYTFKPKKQSDIDIVAQYCTISGAPIHNCVYKETDYTKDLAAILNHYHHECTGAEGIKVGHMYLVIVIADLEFTSVIDIEKVTSLWTDLLKDVKENY